MNGTCNSSFWARPLGRGQISLNFNYKVNVNRLLFRTLCVCSRKWKISNISNGIYKLSPGSCPRGGTLWCWGSKTLAWRFAMVPHRLYSSICIWHEYSSSTLDRQRICVNTQLKSSEKQLKLNECVPKSNSNDRYAITCDVIAYHLVHFISIRLINKCQSGIDFIFTSERAIYSSFMKISVPSPVFAEKH